MARKVRDLEGFFEELVAHFGGDANTDLDVDIFLNLAEERGLIRWEVYNPVVHGDDVDAEAGIDKIWFSTADEADED